MKNNNDKIKIHYPRMSMDLHKLRIIYHEFRNYCQNNYTDVDSTIKAIIDEGSLPSKESIINMELEVTHTLMPHEMQYSLLRIKFIEADGDQYEIYISNQDDMYMDYNKIRLSVKKHMI